jgi:hypothetical protein
MKDVQRLFSWMTVALVLGLSVLVAGVAAESAKLTEGQFRALATSARSAEDHTRLAAYYRAHAADHEADAKLHEDIVAMSRKSPADNQAWEVGRAAAHYAEHSHETAEALRGLAAIHEGDGGKDDREEQDINPHGRP